MKFTVKGLIALFVTSSALFLTPMKSDAQVNMKSLAEVADSCQKDVPSKKYYQQMLLNFNSNLNECIRSRYHYSLILDKFPELASTGEILPGYPGSVAVGELAITFSYYSSDTKLLDCIIANDSSSNVCWESRKQISERGQYRYHFRDNTNGISYYLPYICPSCVVAHDEVSGSGKVILNAFIQWFLKLDKPQRREVISLLGDEDEARTLRQSLKNESEKAVEEYQETRERVEQQEQERRRRELLGN
ncbi:hypothetical protein [Sphaerospermopsis sp. LEGE 08334]|uniref:hypothetical protein n=1 Tax=Sphaerospermopsis sp. LEGE 08334 TaxID=1828651 RepID=UPI001882AA63|nr:hypothetical protein [Sphaerospermopsis sp. LEGE 08334]MBE9054711.1 hypothetical protein [Sphaerospermopsis sp. LEGE 08334]